MQRQYKRNPAELVRVYREMILPLFPVCFSGWFLASTSDPTQWFEKRLAFARSTAVWSMVGHIIGLGDRHGENMMLDQRSGEAVHVDFDCIFDKGRAPPPTKRTGRPRIVPHRHPTTAACRGAVSRTERAS